MPLPLLLIGAAILLALDDDSPSGMTAGAINKELDRLDAEGAAVTDALIAAGRGSERPSETLRLDDSLSMRARSNFERRAALRAEIVARYGPGAPSRLPLGGRTIRMARISRKSPEGAKFIGAALRRLKAEGVPEGERIGRALAEARAAGFR